MTTGEVKMYLGHKGLVNFISILGERMFTGSDDQTVIIWDIQTKRVLEYLKGHTGGVTCIAFANNDIFTGSYTGYWGAPSKESILEYEKKMNVILSDYFNINNLK